LGDHRAATADAQRARELAARLGMGGVLRAVPAPAHEWSLLRDGDDWILEADAERARLRDTRGLHYLRTLVANPGRDVPALVLVSGGAAGPPDDAAPVLDATARAAIRRRLAALDDELAAADAAGDAERSRRAAAERAAVVAELRRATGLGGRDRRLPAEAERARVNVTRTLRATMARISLAAPLCGAHLEASVRTGRACRYEPAPGGPQRWRT
jgi:hypothetical protein